MRTYRAPWGWPLILVSGLSTLILLSVAVAIVVAMKRPVDALFAALPLVLLFATLPFLVRGYSLEAGRLYVERLLWRTEVALDGLRSVEVVPNAMRGSLRSFGNGGLFSITGHYYNKTLGKYRAWVTDLPRTVVLKFDGRSLVLSPEDPARFAEDLRKAKRLAA